MAKAAITSTMMQLREMKDWLQDRSDAMLDVTEKLHMVMMHKPVAALEKIEAFAGPAHLLDRVQTTVTLRVFRSLRALNDFNAKCADHMIDQLEAKAKKIRR